MWKASPPFEPRILLPAPIGKRSEILGTLKVVTPSPAPKEMPIAAYGHYGFTLLLVPTAGADYLEYERFGLIDAIGC